MSSLLTRTKQVAKRVPGSRAVWRRIRSVRHQASERVESVSAAGRGLVERRAASRRTTDGAATAGTAADGADHLEHVAPTEPVDIGLVGFFGWGNFGDELFLKVHQEQLTRLGSARVVHDITKKPYFSQGVDAAIEGFDAFVIGGGDLVIPWQISELYWRREYLRRPVFIVGVGVPTWKAASERHVNRYREYFQHPNVKVITARDIESKAWIEEHLQPSIPVECAPDLVWAMDPVEFEPAEDRVFGVILRARRNANDDFTQVRLACDRAEEYGYRIRHIVLANLERGPEDLAIAEAFAKPGEEVVFTESLDEQCAAIASCAMVASMKFHGTIVAALHGVPAVTLSSTDKTRNFIRAIDRHDLFSAYSKPDLHERVPRHPARISPQVREVYHREAIAFYDDLRTRIVDECRRFDG